MASLPAAIQLAQRAVDNGSFIESVCLSATIIDALLRMGLILDHQIRTNSSEILNELLYQPDESAIVSERAIYRRALKQSVISSQLYARLNGLYQDRNRVVHQYIISDITTENVVHFAAKFADTVHQINSCVRRLEDEQMRMRCGMTTSGVDIPKALKEDALNRLNVEIQKKHGNTKLAQILRGHSKRGAT